MSQSDTDIGCRDQCGNRVADMKEAESKGWEWLPVQRAYRCVECWRKLNEVNFPKDRE